MNLNLYECPTNEGSEDPRFKNIIKNKLKLMRSMDDESTDVAEEVVKDTKKEKKSKKSKH